MLFRLLYSLSGFQGAALEEKETPALGAMLNQEELAFIKAVSTLEPIPAFLREPRKATAAKQRRTAVASSKVKAFCVAPIKPHPTTSGAGSEAKPSCELSQQLGGGEGRRKSCHAQMN